ncbi:DNA-directed RNA polymerase subunit alpha [Patescibacteria group bacterium]|nr:DNA-directed RNA polymerase subunit alpha [Patescibacteria group bacterium]MBU4023429.1 DNA-directed RNA polymerase subunit alpha [Patescibacteria group bacterium]MBU4077990.1 DNA-directed RNA polymerase subunit alpha [Patescibacteria group bacterium]
MIPLPQPVKISEKKDNYVSFVIEGLYPGYGVTLGNALRRVLLSSLEGAAITQVKIKGVDHEFSTISGILEDVITICLNLKKLRFKIYSDEPQKAILKIKGEIKITGKDFELPSQLELVNSEQHIANLTDKKANLEMEILIKKGIGYESKEMRDKDKLEVGQLSLDATYTPIKRVSFDVENMRVGERTDFDRLILNIETDGTTTPEEALLRATEILDEHFSLIINEKDQLIGEKKKKIEKVKKVSKKKVVRDTKAVKKVSKKTESKKPVSKKSVAKKKK